MTSDVVVAPVVRASNTTIPTTITTTTPTPTPTTSSGSGSASTTATNIISSPPSSESMWDRLRQEAVEALEEEPELRLLLHRTILAPGVSSFEEAIAMTVCYRLLQTPCHSTNSSGGSTNSRSNSAITSMPAPVFCPNSLNELLRQALINTNEDCLELGHTMSEAVRCDAMAVLDRDPACDTLLEVVLFMKGFAALVCHRAARQKWRKGRKGRSLTALFLQSQASAVFAVDIHPAATIGAGILLDHGTGIVIGETARVGDGCTFLHGVTLGGTGKDHGDRHPKIGPHVLIGAGATILGNITVGARAKIGAGSVVLKTIPAGATAVGAPAKIIGRTLEVNPANDMDENLHQVGMLHKSNGSNGSSSTNSLRTESTVTLTSHYNSSSNSEAGVADDDDDDDDEDSHHSHNDNDNDNDDNDHENNKEGVVESLHDNPPTIEDDDENEEKNVEERPPNTSTGKPLHNKKQEVATTSTDVTTEKAEDAAAGGSYGSSMPPGCTCPFRDYTRMALTAPAGTLTIISLGKVLRLEGCNSDEIGCTFFELDTRNVGYIRWHSKKTTKNSHSNKESVTAAVAAVATPTQDRLAAALENNTKLTKDRIDAVVHYFQVQHDLLKSAAAGGASALSAAAAAASGPATRAARSTTVS